MQTIRPEIADAQIITSCQTIGQQEKGFRLLLSKYQERLYWHIRRLVIGHEDANDVLQNTLVKAFKGIARFKGHSALYTWLYRIATNEALTFLKKQKRRNTQSIDEELCELANQLCADEYFDGEAATVKLHQAIAQLPERQKLVFNLRYFDEMPYRDISDVLNTSVGGLKASYHHATKKIEQFIRSNVD